MIPWPALGAFIFDNYFRTDQRKHKTFSQATLERSNRVWTNPKQPHQVTDFAWQSFLPIMPSPLSLGSVYFPMMPKTP